MNTRHQSTSALTVFPMLALAVFMVLQPPVALAKKNELPPVSKDGLHLVKSKKSRIVYAKPGAALDGFTRVKILDCFVQFKDGWQKDYNLDEVGLEGRVNDKDAEDIRKRLADEFRKEFTRVLEKKGHAVVDETGEGVLLVRPAIINLQVTAPDVLAPGMRTTIIQSAGSMTLYMELYDSATSELLARVIDAQADRNTMAEQANRVTNKAAADRIISRWAGELAEHLGDVKAATVSE